MIRKVWYLLASSFAVGKAGFTSFNVGRREVVGVDVKSSVRQYFERSVPHWFADPARLVGKFERKLKVVFPKFVFWISTTARPLEIR